MTLDATGSVGRELVSGGSGTVYTVCSTVSTIRDGGELGTVGKVSESR